jgi:hypothetical protein
MQITNINEAIAWRKQWDDSEMAKNMITCALNGQFTRLMLSSDSKETQDIREVIGYLKLEYFKLTWKAFVCTFSKMSVA